jgi:3-oxoacyl-[acyl-carrier protein] reductase
MSRARSQQVVVTGAAGALGAAVCRGALLADWEVIAVDRRQEALEELRERLGERDSARFRIEVADLTRPQEVERLPSTLDRDRAVAVAHLAGGFLFRHLHEASTEEWRHLVRLNLDTTFEVVRVFAAHFRTGAGGSLVAVSSAHALRSPAGVGAYAATKAGVLRLIEAAAAEAQASARFNAVMPHTMDTPANRAAMPDVDPTTWLRTEDAAEVILFLLSDRARAINGAALELGRRD